MGIVIQARRSLVRFPALHTGRVHFSRAADIVLPLLLAAGRAFQPALFHRERHGFSHNLILKKGHFIHLGRVSNLTRGQIEGFGHSLFSGPGADVRTSEAHPTTAVIYRVTASELLGTIDRCTRLQNDRKPGCLRWDQNTKNNVVESILEADSGMKAMRI